MAIPDITIASEISAARRVHSSSFGDWTIRQSLTRSPASDQRTPAILLTNPSAVLYGRKELFFSKPTLADERPISCSAAQVTCTGADKSVSLPLLPWMDTPRLIEDGLSPAPSASLRGAERVMSSL